MAKKNTILSNWPKHLLQWGVLLFIVLLFSGVLAPAGGWFAGPSDVEAYCPIGGVQSLATYLNSGTLACSMTATQIIMGVALIVAVIFFGKLFCGYVCPLGTLNELFFRIRKALNIRPVVIRQGSAADKLLRIPKYALLFVVFYMTMSRSELFCKAFDPYYALATGFSGDTVLWMGVVSLVLLFGSALFTDMFWCKYICPAGAMANVFKYLLWVLLPVAVLAVAGLAGLEVPMAVVLAAVCVSGYLVEALMPGTRITLSCSVRKDEDLCNHMCRSCDNACPYHINISERRSSRVRSSDCTLCGECVASCPRKALKIGPSRTLGKYLPAALTVALFSLAVVFSGKIEIPTIDLRWDMENAGPLKTYELTEVKSMKCYGSAMKLKSQVEKIDGVHGIRCFVRSKTAVIYYDPAVIQEVQLAERLMPQKSNPLVHK